MKRFVVAHMDFFGNHLIQEIVEAETEQDARWLHSKTNPESGWEGGILYRRETDAMDADEFQQWCFNRDMLISVTEV